MTSTPLSELNSTYDMIVLFQVLEHLGELRENMAHIIRLLNKNGILIISVPNPESYLKDIDSSLLNLPPHHSSGWYKKTFDFIAQTYHLTEIHYSREPMRYIHYCYYRNEKILLRQRASGLHARSVFEKMIRIAERKFFSLFYYFNYIGKKNKMIGQTHFVALRK